MGNKEVEILKNKCLLLELAVKSYILEKIDTSRASYSYVLKSFYAKHNVKELSTEKYNQLGYFKLNTRKKSLNSVLVDLISTYDITNDKDIIIMRKTNLIVNAKKNKDYIIDSWNKKVIDDEYIR